MAVNSAPERLKNGGKIKIINPFRSNGDQTPVFIDLNN